ncbi:hypothetical protein BDR07DRAFT_1463441 [Suillus spraguei]|nr:hypothetical protein BDR07DRAFT_1463441 [Suillus spraguei]
MASWMAFSDPRSMGETYDEGVIFASEVFVLNMRTLRSLQSWTAVESVLPRAPIGFRLKMMNKPWNCPEMLASGPIISDRDSSITEEPPSRFLSPTPLFPSTLNSRPQKSLPGAGGYLSRVAASRALAKQDILHEIIEKTVQAHYNILNCLRPHAEACAAYVSFFSGYVEFHATLKRYKMDEIMVEMSS